jgi:hypothetical protein
MWSKIARMAATAAGAALLGGCVLSSSIPFVPPGDAPADIRPGTYQLYMAAERDQIATLPPAKQAACIDPGSIRPPDDEYGRDKERLHYAYCPHDTDGGAPRQRVVIRHKDGRLEMQGDKLPGEVPTMPIAPQLYLAQLDQRSVVGRAKYDYHLLRTRAAVIEIFPLFCGLFESLEDKEDDGNCEAPSLAAVRPELDAAVAKIGTGEFIPAAKLVPIP